MTSAKDAKHVKLRAQKRLLPLVEMTRRVITNGVRDNETQIRDFEFLVSPNLGGLFAFAR
jgi:hypothetical protein